MKQGKIEADSLCATDLSVSWVSSNFLHTLQSFSFLKPFILHSIYRQTTKMIA